MKPAAIGIDLGGTNLKVAVVDADGRALAKDTQECDVARGPEHVMAQMGAICEELLRHADCPRQQVRGVGLGTPGPLDLDKGEIVWAANLPGWRNVPIRDSLSRVLRLPVILENDANAAAFGEFWAGAGRDHGDMVLLTLGTGVGSGVIVDGKLLRGHFENAGELGHWIMDAEGLPCPCGQRGCLEQYASASAVGRRALAAIEEGAKTTLRALREQGVAITSREVAAAARAGDPLARSVWDDACKFLALACVNIQHAFNPALIVLGGGLAEAGDFLLGRVRDKFREYTWKLHNDQPQIALAQLRSDAGMIGAAGLVWSKTANSELQ
jgi:glucokinase